MMVAGSRIIIAGTSGIPRDRLLDVARCLRVWGFPQGRDSYICAPTFMYDTGPWSAASSMWYIILEYLACGRDGRFDMSARPSRRIFYKRTDGRFADETHIWEPGEAA